MLTHECEKWRQGHAAAEAVSWAEHLSDGERVSALMTLAHLGWTFDEQAKFAAIWSVIVAQQNAVLAAAGEIVRSRTASVPDAERVAGAARR